MTLGPFEGTMIQLPTLPNTPAARIRQSQKSHVGSSVAEPQSLLLTSLGKSELFLTGLQDSVTSMLFSHTLSLHPILITNLYRRVDIITDEGQVEINIHTHSPNESMRSVPSPYILKSNVPALPLGYTT